MTLPIVAVIAPGAMGAAVAKRLTTAGLTVLTDLTGRSDATKARARDAGMLDTPLPQIASRASWILSILPPSEALSFARSFRDVYLQPPALSHPVTFVDCNAVNPDTVKNIATVFKSSPITFLDAGIIGGPPRGEYDPIFYASANPVDRAHLDHFESLSKYGLKVSALRGQGADIGDASALKMSYAGISKGIIGICTTMILAAHSSSPATADALLRELAHSQPLILQRIISSTPNMLPKAYRWVGEMEEISSFVGGGEASTHHGLASLYQRVDNALQHRQQGDDIDILSKFVEDAKKAIAEDK